MDESELAEINIRMENITLAENEAKEREVKEKEIQSYEENISKFVSILMSTNYINRQLSLFCLDKEANAWLNRIFLYHDWYEHKIFSSDMIFSIEIKMCSHSYGQKLECKDCMAIREKATSRNVSEELFSFRIRACIVGTIDLGLYEDQDDERNYIDKYQLTISPLRIQDAHSSFFITDEDITYGDSVVDGNVDVLSESENEENIEEDIINEETEETNNE